MNVWGESLFPVIQGHLRSRYSDVKVKYTHGLYIIVKNDHKYLSRKGIGGVKIVKIAFVKKEFFVSITSLYIRF